METETVIDESMILPPDPQPEVVTPDPEPPPPDPPDMAKVREYFTALQADLTKRVAAIEIFLGFVEGTEALGTRVSKLESFLGVK